MTSELDEDSGYLLVKRNGKVIANYPIDELNELANRFKDKDMCSTSDFKDYESLDDFIYSIYFLEFFECFLDYLHSIFRDEISYEKYKTNSELVIYKSVYFKDIIEMCSKYVFNYIDINMLYTQLKNNIRSINMSSLNLKIKNPLLRLYLGLLYFTESIIKNTINSYTKLLLFIKNAVVYNSNKISNKISIKNSKVELLCSHENILEYRKNLLSNFRLFQRKYLSTIAKLRRIGAPNDSKKKSQEIKKELNKNKKVDYKAYEIFCKYVLSKEENETIYDYLAGIHKNTFKGVIHKNINNNTVNKIKVNTKKTHHKEYFEKSKEILEAVESKIKEHEDIIDTKTKSQVKIIRALFDSEQFKNMTLSFGNENSPSIGGKIIHDCKRIRAINKEIDEMIKEYENKEAKKQTKQQKQEKREEMLKLFDELKSNTTLTNDVKIRKKLAHLVRDGLLRKTKNLSQEELNTINKIHNKLNKILPKL